MNPVGAILEGELLPGPIASGSGTFVRILAASRLVAVNQSSGGSDLLLLAVTIDAATRLRRQASGAT